MTSTWDLANPQLRDLAVYEPGKPIEETARQLDIDPGEIVKLASNENPLGPSPQALEAMRIGLTNSHFYPDGGAFYLRNAIAQHVDLARDNIILGNGSNEIIEFVSHAFLRPGDEIVTARYAFIAYKIIATVFGARAIEVPTSENFEQNLDAMLDAITPKTRIVFIANPNNPTGALSDQRKIDNYMSRVPENIVTVFDEAYFEFLDHAPDVLGYVRENRRVVVARTFSKIHGLAGLRVGYGIAPNELTQVLQKTREPFNVNSIAQIGAIAALHDLEHQRLTKTTVDQGRVFLEQEFTAMSRRFIPSAANFIMVHVGDGAKVFQEMLKRKVIVRPLGNYGLAEWVRVSIGTMEQNEKCIAALKKALSQ